MKTIRKKLSILISQILIISLLIPVNVFAVPANPKPFQHIQPDGSVITVIKKGDEFFNYYTDDNNKLLIPDENGDYSYATDGESEASVLADVNGRRHYAELSGYEYEPVEKVVPELVTLNRLRENNTGSYPEINLKTPEYIPLVLIVVSCNNIGYREDFTWSDKLFDKENSLKSYYLQMSDNKFTFEPAKENCKINGIPGFDEENDGIIHVTVDKEHINFTSLAPNYISILHGILFEALDEASKYIDFPSYDKNGNNTIDNDELGVGFVLAGYDPSCSDKALQKELGVSSNYLLWPHQYGLYYNKRLIDGIEFDSYIAIPEQSFLGRKVVQAHLGTIFHELGHYIGLPDM